MATQKSETRSDQILGVVPSVAYLALDAVDRGQSTAIGVLQDARTELRTFVDHGIDLADKGAASLLRLARKVTQRVDDGVAETLASTERLIANAVSSARQTTKAAAATANTALSGLSGASAAA